MNIDCPQFLVAMIVDSNSAQTGLSSAAHAGRSDSGRRMPGHSADDYHRVAMTALPPPQFIKESE